MRRIVFHVDVNSAFLSWTATKMVQEGKDDIRLVPSVISGDPEKRTSVVLAKSVPAKKYNINTGEPLSMALRKYPNLVVAKPDFKLYSDFSRKFMDICRDYSPTVEKYSIDECFLDMTGTERIFPDIIKTAYELKDRIKNELGFTVNVGVGSNKLLAKTAGDFEKPDKVHTLFTEEIEEKMWSLPVGDLLYLGKSTAEKLNRMLIYTIGDLAKADLTAVQYTVGKKAGEQLIKSANGIDDSPVSDAPREAKGYGHSITVENDIKTYDEAYGLLMNLCDASAMRMRADDVRAYCVCVNIRDNNFKNKSHQKKLDNPTDITIEIFNVAKELYRELWDGETPLRLIGVSLSEVTKEKGEQISMFIENEESKDKGQNIDKTVDNIRHRYGNTKIMRGSALTYKKPKKQFGE